MTQNQERIKVLSEVLQSYAPTPKDMLLVDRFTSKIDTNDAERLLGLVGALYDGLSFGNWPWTAQEKK